MINANKVLTPLERLDMAKIKAANTTAPTSADPKEVKRLARNLTDEALACRDVGHTWRMYRLVKVRGGYNRDLFCPTCKTSRHEFINRNGEKLSTHYTYPDGYQIKGVGRLMGNARNTLRLESVIRNMDRAVAEGGDAAVTLPYDEETGEPRVAPVDTPSTPRLRVVDETRAANGR